MTTPSGTRADGAEHVDAVDLMDYWLAALPGAEEEAIEEHLLACDVCGDRLREAIALAEALRGLARSGSLQVIVDESYIRRARASGMRVREYAPPSGAAVQCTVAIDDDLLVARLAVGVSMAARVDLSWCDLHGVERGRMTDIPNRVDAGSIICQQSITWAKASPTTSLVARLLAVDEQGNESVLGDYTFHHTRTIAGPPGWDWI